jgi:hypothetical protein
MPKNKLVLSASAVADEPTATGLTHESIKCFESAKGKGRGLNDANNTLRETILSQMMLPPTPQVAAFMAAELPLSHTAQWRHIYNEWHAALKRVAARCEVPDPTAMTVRHKGGRASRSDFEVEFEDAAGRKQCASIEFKFNAVPQFINLPASKPLHALAYARFYYDKYLDKVMDMYHIPATEKPAYDVYVRHLYGSDYSKHPLFAKLKAAEDAAANKVAPQTPIVKESIAEYLVRVADTTDCDALTREFKSQIQKHFLIYKNGTFHHDMYSEDELTVRRVVRVANNNTLVTESMKDGTFHHLLLRWKNHQGILYPAWQIKLVRAAPATAAPATATVLKHRKK